MKRALVSLISARAGGALTVAQSFVDSIRSEDYPNYVIIAPKEIRVDSNIKSITVNRTGFMAIFYTLFVVPFLAFSLRCKVILCFNNICPLFSIFAKRAIYFHNLNIIYGAGLKYQFLRFLISRLRVHFLFCQTSYTLDCFSSIFPRTCQNCSVVWSGVPDITSISRRLHPAPIDNPMIVNDKLKILVPVTDVNSVNKGIEELKFWLKDNRSALSFVEIFIPAHLPEELSKLMSSVQTLSRSDFIKSFDTYDIMLFPSKLESVGLPIFEFAYTGKPVIIIDEPYVDGIQPFWGMSRNIVRSKFSALKDMLDILHRDYTDFVDVDAKRQIKTSADWHLIHAVLKKYL